jgi:hypothetical protein
MNDIPKLFHNSIFFYLTMSLLSSQLRSFRASKQGTKLDEKIEIAKRVNEIYNNNKISKISHCYSIEFYYLCRRKAVETFLKKTIG